MSGQAPSAGIKALRLRRQSRLLEIDFEDGLQARLPFEYLRVYSRSAEVRGHGPSQAVLQTGKRDVGIDDLETVGQYGIRLIFDDGHDSGIYAWAYLRELAVNQTDYWQDYLSRLETSSSSRDPESGSGDSAD